MATYKTREVLSWLDLDETAVVGWYGEEVHDLSLGNDAVRIRNN
jgi:hypothetical protein